MNPVRVRENTPLPSFVRQLADCARAQRKGTALGALGSSALLTVNENGVSGGTQAFVYKFDKM
jgi:hypothetical protein